MKPAFALKSFGEARGAWGNPPLMPLRIERLIMRWVSPTRKRVFLMGLDNAAAEMNRWVMPK